MRSSLKVYILGFVTLAAAVLLRWVLDPWIGDALPLVTLFGAVAAAVWLGGYRVAIPVTLLGYLICVYLFIPPRGSFDLSRADVVGLIAYLFTCALIIIFGEATRIAGPRILPARTASRSASSSAVPARISIRVTPAARYRNS